MAKYVSQCGWALSSNEKLGRVVENLNDYVLRDKPQLPQKSLKHVQEAIMHINSAIIQLGHASRTLIEADAAGLSQEKEVDHEA